MKKIILVVGIRPNFMKAAPLYRELEHEKGIKPILVHTGQHYDYRMSKSFFAALDLPSPDYNLNAKSGTHSAQTAKMMIGFEKVLLKENPDMVVVFGDGNTTLATALVAKKMNYPLAHVEAGLRSFDESMPEEINRRVTDQISDLLFTPSADGNKNLVKEGIDKKKIYLVGNIMIDSLKRGLRVVQQKQKKVLGKYGLGKGEYCLLTFHRPSNVDEKKKLKAIMGSLELVSKKVNIVLPLHPRTHKNLQSFNLPIRGNIKTTQPLGYIEFVSLMKNAKIVITDSGGIQEETSFLDIPCLTLRPNTERPITITHGTNKLVNENNLFESVERTLKTKKVKTQKIPLWDGRTARRISKVLLAQLA